MSDMQILENVVLFDFLIGGSTGEKTVESDDFIREVGKMMPKGSFSWVSKYRSDAKRETLKVGVARRVENRIRGYFVPMAKATDLSARLKEIQKEFDEEKAAFLKRLPDTIDKWASAPENAGFTKSGQLRSDLIRQHAPTASDLDRLLRFSLSAIRVQSAGYFGEEDTLNSEVKGLTGQAAYEISEDARKSWSGANSSGGDKTTSRVLGLVKRIREKADSMSILSTKFTELRDMADNLLATVPSTGTIEGHAFFLVSGFLSFCLRPENILGEHSTIADAQMAAAGDDSLDANVIENKEENCGSAEDEGPLNIEAQPEFEFSPMPDNVVVPHIPAPHTQPQVLEF